MPLGHDREGVGATFCDAGNGGGAGAVAMKELTSGVIMDPRRVQSLGALLWAVVGAAVALSSVSDVNADARVLVAAASIVGPLAAVAASRLLARGDDRAAGALLLLSALTPTYFAYVLNVPALLIGAVLLAAPRAIVPRPVPRARLDELA